MQNKNYYKYIGDQFRQLRINKGLSLQDVADRIGVTRMTIANYETARTRIPQEIAKKLCSIYGIDFDAFTISANVYL